MSTAIWTKHKLDRYWLLQQRARAICMRLTGVGQGSAVVHLQTAGSMLDGGTFDDLDAVEARIAKFEDVAAQVRGDTAEVRA